ncbi:MAG: hypothetical protein H6707_16560 [Deltaproteobacteria bacterium]|nr:hypothetical protein [Deltaproteobacteria bacterium]
MSIVFGINRQVVVRFVPPVPGGGFTQGGLAVEFFVPQTRESFVVRDPWTPIVLNAIWQGPKTLGQIASFTGLKSKQRLKTLVDQLFTAGVLADIEASPPPRMPKLQGLSNRDPGSAESFVELLRKHSDDGVFREDSAHVQGSIGGVCRFDGRQVVVFVHLLRLGQHVVGGADFEKFLRLHQLALTSQLPFVLVGGLMRRAAQAAMPIQPKQYEAEFFTGTQGFSRLFQQLALGSGRIPQIAIGLGFLCGPFTFLYPFGDVFIMGPRARWLLADPAMVKNFFGQDTTAEEIASAETHAAVSGMCDLVAESDEDAIFKARQVLSHLPSYCGARTPRAKEIVAPQISVEQLDALERRMDADQLAPFDMLEALEALVDRGSLLQVKDKFAPEMLTAWARLGGHTVGIAANNSKYVSGAFTINALKKAARFVSLCDAFNVPLLFFHDTTGLMADRDTLKQGIMGYAARLYSAVAHASVPKFTIALRKSLTAGLFAFCGPGFDPDCYLMLPGATVTTLGDRSIEDLLKALRAEGTAEAWGQLVDHESNLRTPMSTKAYVHLITPLKHLREELIARLELVPENPVQQGRRGPPKKHETAMF